MGVFDHTADTSLTDEINEAWRDIEDRVDNMSDLEVLSAALEAAAKDATTEMFLELIKELLHEIRGLSERLAIVEVTRQTPYPNFSPNYPPTPNFTPIQPFTVNAMQRSTAVLNMIDKTLESYDTTA